MLASHYFSHKDLLGVSTGGRREMLQEIGVDLSAEDPRFLHGQMVYREERTGQVEFTHKRTGEKMLSPVVTRKVWETGPAPSSHNELDQLVVEQLAGLVPLIAAS